MEVSEITGKIGPISEVSISELSPTETHHLGGSETHNHLESLKIKSE